MPYDFVTEQYTQLFDNLIYTPLFFNKHIKILINQFKSIVTSAEKALTNRLIFTLYYSSRTTEFGSIYNLLRKITVFVNKKLIDTTHYNAVDCYFRVLGF